MISRRHRARRLKDAPELEITAFMNLMVVLVPFLLLTAVFSRMTILQVDLPAASSAEETEQEDPPLQLEVTVRQDRIEVGDRTRGLFGTFPVTPDKSELEALNAKLIDIKAENPDVADATLLLEPDVVYERVIELMDAIRQSPEVIEQPDGSLMHGELFPAISIGDAPVSEEAPTQ